jgi:hypothetical protein
MKSECLQPNAPPYPAALKTGKPPAVISQIIGNPQLLAAPKTAMLCSHQCPGEVILRLFDLAKRLRTSDLTFIGGFHTPAERDFLHHLRQRANAFACRREHRVRNRRQNWRQRWFTEPCGLIVGLQKLRFDERVTIGA